MANLELADLERFDSKWIPEPNSGCWLWMGATGAGRKGQQYGVFNGDGDLYAHRESYRRHKGPIPRGLTIDHLCRTRLCVNPDHLEAVTDKENKRRGESPAARNARKTHCLRGHSLEAGNLRKNKQSRACAECARGHDMQRKDDPRRQQQRWQSYLRTKDGHNERRRLRYASDPVYRARRRLQSE